MLIVCVCVCVCMCIDDGPRQLPLSINFALLQVFSGRKGNRIAYLSFCQSALFIYLLSRHHPFRCFFFFFFVLFFFVCCYFLRVFFFCLFFVFVFCFFFFTLLFPLEEE